MSVQETSIQAFQEVLPELGPRQQAVLAVIAARGPATNSEIARELGWSINRVTPRTNELVKADRVEEACKRRCAVTGRMAIAWKVRDGRLF